MTSKKKSPVINTFQLPEGLEMVGTFKLKDQEGRQAIRLNLKQAVKSVVIQKVQGENNKFVVAIEKGEISPIKLIGQ